MKITVDTINYTVNDNKIDIFDFDYSLKCIFFSDKFPSSINKEFIT